MISARIRPLLGAALVFAAAISAQDLESALGRMDRLSKGFRGLTADLHRITYTAVIKQADESSGRLTVFRAQPKDLRMLVEIDKPDPGAVAVANNKVQIYYPKIAEVQEYDLSGKQNRLIEEFLLLGFGTSTSDLGKKYSIKYMGMATVQGLKADLLELVPKSTEAREHFPRIEMWIAQDGGYPLRLKLHQPSKDYQEAEYTNVRVNPPNITEAAVRLKPPKGVKRVRPQK
ncbi:MAG: outer membrane lipoprotein carrier protein LolA [Bryobacteraceae bacterium]|jgi:outer membrane lipoprotein-sorting protein